ncbi:MAG: hypothetical protein ACQERC_04360 [Bacteroidota bacterium]
MIVFDPHYCFLKNKTDIQLSYKECLSIADYNLFIGRDVDFYQHKVDNKSLTLLGFAFDINDPDKTENDILEDIAGSDNIPAKIDFLSGNFLLISEDNKDIAFYNDAAGVFKLFYLIEKEEIIGLASDIKLLSHFFNTEKVVDPGARDFYSSDFFKKSRIRPGEKTNYQGIKHLLPNHRLLLKQGEMERYFPANEIPDNTVEESLQKVKKYFDNVIEAAVKRYNVKCSLTAGWDSRVLLLCTKNVMNKTQYYTFVTPKLDNKSKDIKIPQKLSNKLNLNYRTIDFDKNQDNYNRDNLRTSYEHISERRINAICKGFSNFDKKDDLALIGTVSEICKNYYDNVIINGGVSLTKSSHFPVNDYTVAHFSEKYSELEKINSKFGYNIADIAHWEQDITNFAAQNTFYNMYAVKTFSPFNSRQIIKTILSVPSELRDQQSHLFYRYLFDKYWSELNKVPVNPNIKTKLIRIGKKIGVYRIYKIISTRSRS